MSQLGNMSYLGQGNVYLTQPAFQCLQADAVLAPATTQNVAVGGSSAQSAAFQSATTVIRVCSDTDCYIAFGSNPTATANSIFLPASTSECFGVVPGNKVAVIQKSATGHLSILEGTQTG